MVESSSSGEGVSAAEESARRLCVVPRRGASIERSSSLTNARLFIGRECYPNGVIEWRH
jgi:hypothetical protein